MKNQMLQKILYRGYNFWYSGPTKKDKNEFKIVMLTASMIPDQKLKNLQRSHKWLSIKAIKLSWNY